VPVVAVDLHHQAGGGDGRVRCELAGERLLSRAQAITTMPDPRSSPGCCVVGRPLVPPDALDVSRVAQLPVTERTTEKPCVGEVCACEVGVGEIRAEEVGLGQLRAGQLGTDQLGVVEVGASQVGLAEVGVGQLGEDEVSTGQLAS
jgi:hypothetical protein